MFPDPVLLYDEEPCVELWLFFWTDFFAWFFVRSNVGRVSSFWSSLAGSSFFVSVFWSVFSFFSAWSESFASFLDLSVVSVIATSKPLPLSAVLFDTRTIPYTAIPTTQTSTTDKAINCFLLALIMSSSLPFPFHFKWIITILHNNYILLITIQFYATIFFSIFQ